MAFSSNVIASKAKGMYGNRLTISNYEDLLKKSDVIEVVHYLKNETSYSNTLENIKDGDIHRQYIESLLEKNVFINLTRLIRYAPKKQFDFYKLAIASQEIKLIIHIINVLNNQKSECIKVNIPTYLSKYASFDINGLVNLKDVRKLCEYLKNTYYYNVLIKHYNKETCKIDINSLEIEFKHLFYDKYVEVIKKYFKGQKQKDLLTMLNTQIELENITKIYRLKKFFNCDVDVIKNNLLLDYSRISKKEMDELINAKDADEFLYKLSHSQYKIYVDNKDFVFIEYYASHIIYHLAKRFMRFSSDPALIYMTYSILMNIEIENLKHIIEGLRYQEDAEKIRKMLIY